VTIDIQAFQAFLYAQIPLVKTMRMQLLEIADNELTASAPLAPNINDKQTVFGGSSAALMTIAGWSLIKTNLEHHGNHNDVVIYTAENKWLKAQSDDLIIKAKINLESNWQSISEQLREKKRSQKLTVNCQVMNQNNEVCSEMKGQYVILKTQNPLHHC
jgi:thioesterase domain-containing protein